MVIRIGIALTAGLLFVGVASITNANGDIPTSPTTNIGSQLLTLSDLPALWSVDHYKQTTSKSCDSGSFSNLRAIAKAHVIFDYQNGLPELGEQLVLSKSAPSAYAAISHRLNSCHKFTEVAGGQIDHGTISGMSAPKFGNQSTAYEASVVVEGVPIKEGIILVRDGRYLVELAVGSKGALDTGLLHRMTSLALTKLTI